MPNITELGMQCIRFVDEVRNEIIDIGETIYRNPETGYKEYICSDYLFDKFNQLGLTCIPFKGIPGFKATMDTGREGPEVAILGELDSIVCMEHPDCNKKTGAVHACGHNIQLAAMYGAASSIVKSGIAGDLCGKIHFIAVPAEEYIEVEFRRELIKNKVIKYITGKTELLFRGVFDNVDMCMMIHALPINKKIITSTTSNGFIYKNARFIGKASHAAGAPHEGINALYAANLGLTAINSLRETFRDEDSIRVHPILYSNNCVVNVIPSDVRLETLVRGKAMDKILLISDKVDKALVGSAYAMGASIEIENLPGHYPLNSDINFSNHAKRIMIRLTSEDETGESMHQAFSTDMGDLSALMPVIHPFIGGVKGELHSPDFRVNDFDTAYLLGARFLSCMAIELLYNKAAIAGDILSNYKPIFASKEEYFVYIDKIGRSKKYVDQTFEE